MHAESLAWNSRLRHASTAAKAVFAAAGILAALLAPRPAGALACAAVLIIATLLGGGMRWRRYFAILLPASAFLALGALPLAFALDIGANGWPSLRFLPDALPQIFQLVARAIAGMSALLFLSLTTPMTELIALARRLRMPAVLVDLMVLGYRTLFVLLRSMQDMHTAQSARLGYANARKSLRAAALLAANLVVDVLHRARALELAAQARNQQGALRFLPAAPRPQRGEHVLAVLGALLLFALAFGMPASWT